MSITMKSYAKQLSVVWEATVFYRQSEIYALAGSINLYKYIKYTYNFIIIFTLIYTHIYKYIYIHIHIIINVILEVFYL